MPADPRRIAAIEALGARINYDYEYVGEGADRHREPGDTIIGVHLPLDPVQWCAIAQREGAAYVGGCCGNMGAVQDEMNAIFRDSGYAEAKGLLHIGAYARGHEGMEYFDAVDDEAYFQQIADLNAAAERTRGDPEATVDPWGVVGVIFNAVEPALEPNWLDRPRVEEEGIRGAIRVIFKTVHRLRWADLFEDGPREDAEGGRILGQASHPATRLLDFSRILQPMKDVLAYMESEGMTFEGFAVVEPGTEKVMSTYSGLCLYETREDAQWVLDLWARADEDERADRGPLEGEIVPVTVNIAEGLRVHREPR